MMKSETFLAKSHLLLCVVFRSFRRPAVADRGVVHFPSGFALRVQLFYK